MANQAFAPGTFYGATVALTTASTLLTEVEMTDWTGMSREAIETTHLGSTTGIKTFIPGDILDFGEITITGKYSTQLAYDTLFASTGKCDTLTITFAKRATTCGASLPTTAASIAAGVVLMSIKPTWSTTEVMKCEMKYRVNGAFTITPAVV